MRRISTPTASADNQFLDRVSGGRNATQFQASWCNAVQEEIAHVIESTGEALAQDPDAPDNTQLFQAIRTLGFNGYRIASGSSIDFGGRAGNSVIVLTSVSNVLFPNKASCPKNAIVIVVEPWTASTPGPATVSQSSGGFVGPILKGEVAICCFDANGVFTSCVRIPSNSVGGFGLFGILEADGNATIRGALNVSGLMKTSVLEESSNGVQIKKSTRFEGNTSFAPVLSNVIDSNKSVIFYTTSSADNSIDLSAAGSGFVVGQEIRIVNVGNSVLTIKYTDYLNTSVRALVEVTNHATFMCVGGSAGQWRFSVDHVSRISSS